MAKASGANAFAFTMQWSHDAADMRLAVGSDHRGFDTKKRLLPWLNADGRDVMDLGCFDSNVVDYPDFAAAVAISVLQGKADLGILLDGSGIGMAIVANKHPGIYAVDALDTVTSRRAREHHHCNVLCVGTDLLSDSQVREVIGAFLSAKPGEGRHLRRIEKIRAIEAQWCPGER
jgi:ribose 5-phosphate isomerase B